MENFKKKGELNELDFIYEYALNKNIDKNFLTIKSNNNIYPTMGDISGYVYTLLPAVPVAGIKRYNAGCSRFKACQPAYTRKSKAR